MTSRFFAFALMFAALSLLGQSPPVFADGVSATERKAILTLHNSYRAQHCVPALS